MRAADTGDPTVPTSCRRRRLSGAMVPLWNSVRRWDTLRSMNRKSHAAGWERAAIRGLALVVVCVAAGCHGTSPAVETAVLRFSAEAPQEVFEPTAVAEPTTALEIKASRQWRVSGPVEEGRVKEGLLQVRLLERGTASFTLRPGALPAGIDVVEIDVAGLRPQDTVRLLWTAEGERFVKARSLTLSARQGVGAARRTFSFPVGRESTWSDEVEALCVEIEAGPHRIQLGSLRAVRLEIDRQRLDDAAGKPWLCDRAGVVLGALLGLPGRPIERRFRVPEGAVLRFSVAGPANLDSVVDYRVTVALPDGDGEAVEVFRTTAAPGDPEAWRAAEVPLADWVGREVDLSLEVIAEEPLDPVVGLPAWAAPRVWAPAAEEPPPNVVVVSIDTLRADHTSLYGYHRRTTPELDRWARRRAVVFDSTVAATHWTLPSHVSMLTGLDALRHGVNHPVPAPATLATLADMLHARGYATAAVTGGSYLHPRFGLAQGFDEYRSYKGRLTLELTTGVDRALAWLDEFGGRGPWFLFFHTFEVHDPYEPREPFFTRYAGKPFDPEFREAATRSAAGKRPDRLLGTNDFVLRAAEGGGVETLDLADVGVVVDLYDSGIAFTDLHLGRLLERLGQKDLADNTIVVITSDHGEALGEHGLAGHSSLYDHDLLVPLVLGLPGGRFGGDRVAPQVRSVDIVPTILEAAGMPVPEGLDGRSLIPLITGEERQSREARSYTALSNHGLALRGDGRKYIFRNVPWQVPTGWEELYDLAEDPGETANLVGSAETATRLREEARTVLRETESGMRIALHNTGERVCVVELEATGMVVGSSSIKTGRPGEWCRMLGMGRIGCTLGPGDELTLVGERIEDPNVGLTGSVAWEGVARRAAIRLEYEIGAETDPQSLSLRTDSGEGGDADGKVGGLEIALWWSGDPGLLGLDPTDSDAELRQQLRALGYIE